ncbi:MAG: hypothetical protein AABX38_00320 [Candidatus Micrarchaeota archaeon]
MEATKVSALEKKAQSVLEYYQLTYLPITLNKRSFTAKESEEIIKKAVLTSTNNPSKIRSGVFRELTYRNPELALRIEISAMEKKHGIKLTEVEQSNLVMLTAKTFVQDKSFNKIEAHEAYLGASKKLSILVEKKLQKQIPSTPKEVPIAAEDFEKVVDTTYKKAFVDFKSFLDRTGFGDISKKMPTAPPINILESNPSNLAEYDSDKKSINIFKENLRKNPSLLYGTLVHELFHASFDAYASKDAMTIFAGSSVFSRVMNEGLAEIMSGIFNDLEKRNVYYGSRITAGLFKWILSLDSTGFNSKGGITVPEIGKNKVMRAVLNHDWQSLRESFDAKFGKDSWGEFFKTLTRDKDRKIIEDEDKYEKAAINGMVYMLDNVSKLGQSDVQRMLSSRMILNDPAFKDVKDALFEARKTAIYAKVSK